MIEAPTLLLATLAVPLLGALAIVVFAHLGRQVVRQIALVAAGVTLAFAMVLVARYPVGSSDFAAFDWAWLGASSPIDVKFSVALDGLSLWLFGLSALLLVTAVLVSWEAILDRPAAFYALLMLLGAGMLGVFVARDVILFYICFEFTLIPLFFLIGIWGSEDRRYAAIKFFLYTLAGSVLTFLGLLTIVLWDYYHSAGGVMTFSIPALTAGLAQHKIAEPYQLWVFLALFAGFAIKVPLFPLHTWLPLAHTQAPTAGSVLLAGILLKIGTYGFVRFSIPMLPDAAATCAPWLLGLAAAGIVYGALVALAQADMKRLIAYSSVSHLGYCMLGLFALNRLGTTGSVLQMINHGLSTGGLFAVVGMIYDRYHTREIHKLGGLAARTPVLALFFLVFTFSSIGLPGLNGFPGEFMILIGMFQRAWTGVAPSLGDSWQLAFKVMAVAGVAGVVLGAWYMLYLVQRLFFGKLREADHSHDEPVVRDLSQREIWALVPLVVFVVWIGIYPQFFLERIEPSLQPLAQAAERAMAERGTPQRSAASDAVAAAAEGAGNRAARPAEEVARVD